MDLKELSQKIRDVFPEAVSEEQANAIVVKKESLLPVAKFLKESDLQFATCHCISGVDRKDKSLEVVYFLYSFKQKFMLVLKTVLPRENPEVQTVSGLWKSANWLERETFDLYGIKFLNHPDPRRILNPDEWTDWPLRKDFDRPDFYKLPQVQGLKG